MLIWLAACNVDRAPVVLPVRHEASSAQVTPSDGVEVQLDTAEIQIADFRFEGPASASWRFPSPFASAWAHPGHDFAGQVGGELVGTFALDLIGEGGPLGDADCFEGTYATARFDITGPVVFTGTATVDGVSRPFAFEYDADDDISGLPFEGVLDPEVARTTVLAVDLGQMLSFVDWRTPDDDGDGVLTLADGVVANTFPFGVLSTASFSMNLESP